MAGPKANDPNVTRGLNQKALDADHQGALAGTGGAAGGGTRAGRGAPAGGPADATTSGENGIAGDRQSNSANSDDQIAEEAHALGSVEGTLSDASADGPDRDRLSELPGGPVGGENLGTGAGRGEPGSGPPRDKGDLGGGGSR